MKRIIIFIVCVILLACSGSPSSPPNSTTSPTGGISDTPAYIGGNVGTGGITINSAGFAGDAAGSPNILGGSDRGGVSYVAGTSGIAGLVETGGSTIDVGTGGSGNTIDTGSGGTVDTGSGGTIDTSSGGTQDLGSGGSIDTGTGGSIDTCVPSCIPDILGSGEEAVNLVVFEDANASGCDTEGRMWVGGNANLNGYGVGASLSECDTDGFVLVVGGDLTINGGVKGKIWVGGEFSGQSPQCGGIWDTTPGPVDFQSLQDILTGYSDTLGQYPANGTAYYDGSVLVLSGSAPDLNVIEISAGDLSAASDIRIEVPVTSSVVINVVGESVSFLNGTMTLPDGVQCGSGAVSLNDFCNQLLWNLPGALEVSVGGMAVQGSILAPRAVMVASGSGQINGTVIVREFNLETCIEMHPHYFNGCLCTEDDFGPYACC